MAIGYTGSDGNIQQFEYTPVNPIDDQMRQAFEQSQQAFYPPPPQPRGPTPYWENPATYYPQVEQPDPVAQAKAATAAAYKYIAFRGYKDAIDKGKSPADAFAIWGPMMFQDVSFGPAMKALTPAPQPQWMPANAATGQPGAFTGRVTVPPNTEIPKFVPANPTTGEPAHYESGGKITQIRPETAAMVDPLTLIDYKGAEDEFNRALKVYTDAAQPEEVKVEAQKRMDAAKKRMENIRNRGNAPTQQTATVTATPKPAVKEVIRLTRDGKKAVFDSVTKQFIRYAE